ncbi:MAG: TetR/AcrR family transcriptional regulator [Actinomycetota bacterium]|nr:TetR/AcrR family transcriptional regulator [Actinomycetota bacterium]
MDEEKLVPLSGRRAEAARNDGRILEAAREVFTADPGAPVSAVAERAGVGIGALYRRYGSKEDLLRHLNADGLGRYIAVVEAALAGEGDPWQAFSGFLLRAVDTDTHSLTLRLAGTFSPTDELKREGERAHELTQRLLDRTKAAGVLRADIEVGDLSLIFEQMASVRLGDRRRTGQLRRRYSSLILGALRDASAPPLPGPPPSWEEIRRRWEA